MKLRCRATGVSISVVNDLVASSWRHSFALSELQTVLCLLGSEFKCASPEKLEKFFCVRSVVRRVARFEQSQGITSWRVGHAATPCANPKQN